MSQNPAPVSVLPILWASFISTHALFVGISFVVPPSPVADASWVPLLGLVALVPAALSVQAGVLARAVGNVQAWFILRFALAEAAAIFGFLAFFLSGDRLVQLGCATIGIIAHLLAFPSPGAQASFQAARR